jgi:FkbM family methyltransferase
MPNYYEITSPGWNYISSLGKSVEVYKKYFGETASLVADIGCRDSVDVLYLKSELDASAGIAVDANPDVSVDEPGITYYHTAISNYTGETSFQKISSEYEYLRGAASIYSSRLDEDSDDFDPMYLMSEIDVVTVPVTTMDNFIVAQGLENTVIDFMKVDVEGYAGELLEGYSTYLENVKMIHLETEFISLHENHWSNVEIAEFLQSKGFALVGIYIEWSYPIQEQLWANTALIDDSIEVEDLYDHVPNPNFDQLRSI